MDLAIIGSGYVGLVTGACFADVGHNVICVDNDMQKIKQLQAGEVPIYEPGLEEIIHRNVSARRLRFTGSIEEGVNNSQIVFIAVPTPQQPDGDVDLSFLEKVAREIAGVLTDYRVIVDKSTVPVKTGEKVAESIKRYSRIHYDQRAAWHSVQSAQGSPTYKHCSKRAFSEGNPGDPMGVAREANCSLGPDIQARHRRRPFFRGNRTGDKTLARRSARGCLRPEGNAKSARDKSDCRRRIYLVGSG